MLAALAFALAAPAPPPLSEADWAALRAREVVVRDETASQLVSTTGIVLFDAPPERAWAALLDFPARVPENSTLRKIEEYGRAGSVWYLRFEMSVFGVDLTFHNVYERAGDTVTYTLDPARPNDLVACDGWYLVAPVEGGKSLVTYHAESRSRQWAPRWILTWMANDSMEQVLTKIRARAER
ncbi:MAG: SRPBCC family protein [Myxococcota bacterium]